MSGKRSEEAASSTPEEVVVLARRALEAALARVDRLQRQRDEARAQRDFARAQRDDARQQRDALRLALESGGADGAALASAALSLPSDRGSSAEPDRRLRLRNRPPSGFASLPRSELPSSPYSVMRYQEREQARQLIERRIQPRLAAGEPLSLAEREIGALRKVPPMRRRASERFTPPPDVAFVTVADIGFYPGLLGLVLSLVEVYPGLASPLFVYHDGSIGRFAQERLIDVYPNIEFIAPDMNWLDLSSTELNDAKRIGKLGYMKFLALTAPGFQRVIVLDADLMILDDISALWTGSPDDARVVYDLGNREFAIRSDHTGDWIINSGVISLPGSWCSHAHFEVAKGVIRRSLAPLNDLLDQFADQKAWNIFLSDRPLTYLEVNFNCNVKYVGRFLGGKLEAISILHFAGPKPWNATEFLPEELVSKKRSMACVFPNMWIDRYRAMLFKHRSLSYQRDRASRSKREEAPAGSECCVLTDDHAAVERRDLAEFGFPDVVHVVREGLPDCFEELRPDHVVFGSHEYLGGWNSLDPQIPPDCARRIAALESRPVVWAPYYFKPIFEVFARKHGIEVRYLLHEAPFVREVSDVGAADCRAQGFLDSCGDATLTFGIPVAVQRGYRRIVTLADGRADRRICDLDPSISLVAENLRENGIELELSVQPPSPPPAGHAFTLAAQASGL
ncbi:hypothetical protein IHQ68_04900 [Chelatococcus sambhunathii]|uniref:Lipopolysaccharide biosynthesis protein, LPS:glycosyltransferase n=1 Tax=Chelatococcus sambhunathii TaxID=363953 RepID=A0ABU1DCY8_9HYPH|nr:glycosyltransferase [Chelatococcus sambhunathii]MDR4305962.1 hypothetical protein [Chelatococcus sambhunathii]